MSRTSVYKSGVKAAIHQTARDLYDGGVIDKQPMRRFDVSCLTPAIRGLCPNRDKAIRRRSGMNKYFGRHERGQ